MAYIEHTIEPDERDPQWWRIFVPGALGAMEYVSPDNTSYAKPRVPTHNWINWGGALWFQDEFYGVIIEQKEITVTPPGAKRPLVVGREYTVENPLKCRGEK